MRTKLVVRTAWFLALIGVVLGPSRARATQTVIDLEMPVVYVLAGDGPGTAPIQKVDDFSDPLKPLVEAEVTAGGGHAVGKVGLVDWLQTDSVGSAAASTEVYIEFTVEDPQNRPEVKTTLDFTAVASAGVPYPGFLGFTSSADVSVQIGQTDGVPVRLAVDNDTLSSNIVQRPSFVTEVFRLGALAAAGVFNDENGQPVKQISICSGSISVNGQPVSEHPYQEGCDLDIENGRLDLTHAPGSYVMRILIGSSYYGIAISDPVWRPHPDNPDVIVTRHAPTASPDQGLIGVTPDDLSARGIDPAPFIELGLFGPPASADSTPPSTTATPTPGPNGSGWNKSPVTVNLAATDDAGGSGVKEVHYELGGASSGAQVVAGDSATVTIAANGITTLTYFAVDNAGNAEPPHTLTVRIDRTAPVLSGLPAAGCSLWPPNRRLVQVASIKATDALSGIAGTPSVSATSNEPATGRGFGHLAPDIVITGGSVQLRAERAGHGSGRVYTITATATDLAGNTSTATATCKVPHDRRGAAGRSGVVSTSSR